MNILNFIDNQFVPGVEGKWLDNICPATGEVYSRVVASTSEDVERAVAAAVQAFPAWRKTPGTERVRLLLQLAQLLEGELQEFAEAESRDQGKPVSLARQVDIPRAVENFRFFGDQWERFAGDRWLNGEQGENCVRHSPLGVVAVISPWNLPLYLLTWKFAPALVAGNCVVAKPSELTPLTASMLCRLVERAGFPSGVINVVQGRGGEMGDALTGHPRVRAVSFTGSTRTGTHIYAHAAVRGRGFPKRISLEMGGKNPNIIFADCDFQRTLENTLRSSFTNQGEVCTCGSRIFVEQPLYDRFKAALLDAIPDFPQGALVSEGHLNKILGHVESALREGGRILCGGRRKDGPGFFMEPTVIEGLGHDGVANREEIFGPVVTLAPFETEGEVIAAANSVDYGLSASVHTMDRERAERVAQALDVGMVWVNDWMNRDLRTPFGGTKMSGLGREGGEWALRFYTEVKNICYSQ